MTTRRGKGRVLRVLVSALLLLSMMVSAIPVAYAAGSLTGMTLTLSNSAPGGTPVDYTFAWTASGTSIEGLKLQFCQAASGTCSAPGGDFVSTGGSMGAGNFSVGNGWTGTFTSNGTITATGSADTATSVSQVISGITNTGAASDVIATVFYVWITTYSDVGLTTVVDGTSVLASAVIPAVSVTGVQDAILELTVSPVGITAIGDAGDTKNTTATSTATTLPFGTFAPLTTGGEESKAVAHTVNVKTNGATGYAASVKGGSAAMTRSGGSEIVGYVSASPTDWVEDSTTGFGVNAQGGDAETGTFGTSGTYSYHSIATDLTLASDSAPTAGVDTTVVYRVQVAVTQAAGSYSGTVNYTVLPNF